MSLKKYENYRFLLGDYSQRQSLRFYQLTRTSCINPCSYLLLLHNSKNNSYTNYSFSSFHFQLQPKWSWGATTMGMCLMRAWSVHISEFRCHRRQTGTPYLFIITPRRIVWSRMWFNFDGFCCNIGLYIGAIRLLSKLVVLPMFLCHDVILLCPLADVRVRDATIRQDRCDRGTMHNHRNTHDFGHFWTENLVDASK